MKMIVKIGMLVVFLISMVGCVVVPCRHGGQVHYEYEGEESIPNYCQDRWGNEVLCQPAPSRVVYYYTSPPPFYPGYVIRGWYYLESHPGFTFFIGQNGWHYQHRHYSTKRSRAPYRSVVWGNSPQKRPSATQRKRGVQDSTRGSRR